MPNEVKESILKDSGGIQMALVAYDIEPCFEELSKGQVKVFGGQWQTGA